MFESIEPLDIYNKNINILTPSFPHFQSKV